MPDGAMQNLGSPAETPPEFTPAGRQPLEERLNDFRQKEVAWKLYNGGCPMTADIVQTLENLKQNVQPHNDDLPVLVIASLQTYLKPGQTIDDVWSAKVAEGANFVGLVDGGFAFYRGEEKLPTNNKSMEYSVAPAVNSFREMEKNQVREAARQARRQMMNELKINVDPTQNV